MRFCCSKFACKKGTQDKELNRPHLQQMYAPKHQCQGTSPLVVPFSQSPWRDQECTPYRLSAAVAPNTKKRHKGTEVFSRSGHQQGTHETERCTSETPIHNTNRYRRLTHTHTHSHTHTHCQIPLRFHPCCRQQVVRHLARCS